MCVEKMKEFIIRVLFWALVGGLAFLSAGYILPALKPFIAAFVIAVILNPVIRRILKNGRFSQKWVSVMVLVLFYMVEKGISVLLQFGKTYLFLMSLTFAELAVGLSLLKIEDAISLAAIIALADILPVLGVGTILLPWIVVSILVGSVPLGVGLLVLFFQ